MKCAVCGGETKKEYITYDETWGSELYRFEKVPAKVCQSCGEIWLSGKVAEKMDEIIESRIKAKKKIKVPVFRLDKFLDLKAAN